MTLGGMIRRLRGAAQARVVYVMTSSWMDEIIKRIGDATGTRSEVIFYHCVSDPHSVLLLQAVKCLLERNGDLKIKLLLVDETTNQNLAGYATTQSEQFAWRIKDAKVLSELYKDDITGLPKGFDSVPSTQAIQLGNAIFIGKSIEYLDINSIEEFIHVNNLVLLNCVDELEAISQPGMSDESVQDILAANTAVLGRSGHYMSGMLQYGFDWFWGLDRLNYLEEQLRPTEIPRFNRTLDIKLAPVTSCRERTCPIKLFYSFRSPYSQIVLKPLFKLADHYGVNVEICPVLPLAMRGANIPLVKKLYIVRDTKRQARSLGQESYGFLNDPIGEPTRNALRIYIQARHCKKEREYLLSFSDHVYCRGFDANELSTLRSICAQAGFSLDETYLKDDNNWKSLVNKNLESLKSMGLWGVPSFCYGETHIWGQDRLFCLNQAIIRETCN
uniref:DSBA-like thioredoxin domain-containing protein n=1 Tax=Mucochytrium quahogii TaxID=96639 RepID=A0A7S2S7R0_9STRA|mmetsp:Transcript_23349/g.37240  ORF Transcript_23349/g.37240 Transcript_23349/m.37240 type:complete len:444 (-) Transcript_23349:620-1951(-)